MSLTKQDLTEVKEIVVSSIVEAIDTMISPRFDSLEEDVAVLKKDVSDLKSDMVGVKQSLNNLDGRVEAIENDIKELYEMVADLQKAKQENHNFDKLSLEKKVLQTHAEILLVAKEAGIILPNNY